MSITNILLYIIYAVGPLCEYTENSAAETLRQTCASFESYFSGLNFTCHSGPAGRLIWTPDESTPNLVYYQVYGFRYLLQGQSYYIGFIRMSDRTNRSSKGK